PEAIVEMSHERVNAKHRGTCRGKLARERYAVEPAACGSRQRYALGVKRKARIQRPRPGKEQLDGAALKHLMALVVSVRKVERGDGVQGFVRHTQRFPARRQHVCARTVLQQCLREFRGALENMFAV